jgi:hypothetical protein
MLYSAHLVDVCPAGSGAPSTQRAVERMQPSGTTTGYQVSPPPVPTYGSSFQAPAPDGRIAPTAVCGSGPRRFSGVRRSMKRKGAVILLPAVAVALVFGVIGLFPAEPERLRLLGEFPKPSPDEQRAIERYFISRED